MICECAWLNELYSSLVWHWYLIRRERRLFVLFSRSSSSDFLNTHRQWVLRGWKFTSAFTQMSYLCPFASMSVCLSVQLWSRKFFWWLDLSCSANMRWLAQRILILIAVIGVRAVPKCVFLYAFFVGSIGKTSFCKVFLWMLRPVNLLMFCLIIFLQFISVAGLLSYIAKAHCCIPSHIFVTCCLGLKSILLLKFFICFFEVQRSFMMSSCLLLSIFTLASLRSVCYLPNYRRSDDGTKNTYDV